MKNDFVCVPDSQRLVTSSSVAGTVASSRLLLLLQDQVLDQVWVLAAGSEVELAAGWDPEWDLPGDSQEVFPVDPQTGGSVEARSDSADPEADPAADPADPAGPTLRDSPLSL